MSETSKLPPELAAYFEGIFDAEDAPPEVRTMLLGMMEPFYVAMKEGIEQTLVAERARCLAICTNVEPGDGATVRQTIFDRIKAGAEAAHVETMTVTVTNKRPLLCELCGEPATHTTIDGHPRCGGPAGPGQ